MQSKMRRVVFTFLVSMRRHHEGKTVWTRKELMDFANSIGFASIPTWILKDKSRHSHKRGEYFFPEMETDYTGLDTVLVVNDGRGRPRKNLSAVTV